MLYWLCIVVSCAILLLQAQAAEALSSGSRSGVGDLRCRCWNCADHIPTVLQAKATLGASQSRNTIATVEFSRATLQEGGCLLRRAPVRRNRQVSYLHLLSPPYWATDVNLRCRMLLNTTIICYECNNNNNKKNNLRCLWGHSTSYVQSKYWLFFSQCRSVKVTIHSHVVRNLKMRGSLPRRTREV